MVQPRKFSLIPENKLLCNYELLRVTSGKKSFTTFCLIFPLGMASLNTRPVARLLKRTGLFTWILVVMVVIKDAMVIMSFKVHTTNNI